ncbi:MAG TPA: chlorite dismutase family protein [Candidatus Limnocylindrales bacterium]|nr:chlorite dismutase family protein [Candidatus Limnocylindrales bacterium]
MTEEIPVRYAQALAIGFDPGWRRQPDAALEADISAFVEAEARAADDGVAGVCYSTLGLKPGCEVLLWRVGPTVEALQAAAARLLRSGAGRWADVRHALLGQLRGSQYVRKPSGQDQASLVDDPARYLVVYPFTKSTEWYLLGRDARQGIMNEHMRIGHDYASVRQALAYSFGLDDQDFVVAYATDDLVAFGDLVRELRGSDSRRSTIRDTPLLLGARRSAVDILVDLAGAAGPATAGRAAADRRPTPSPAS